MAQSMRIYWRMIRINLLSGMEYKGWWLSIVQTLIVALADIASTFLLFSRFGSIGEWTLERIVLIYSLAVTGFGLAELFYRGFDSFPWYMVRTGEFDRVLLRPRPLALQVAGSRFHLHRIGRVVSGFFLIGWAIHGLGMVMTHWRVLMGVGALAGSFVLYCGVFMLTSGISFFSVKALDWIFILTNASYQVTRCPVPYMPRMLFRMFTFVLPMLVVCYYPASAMGGWGEPVWLGWLALPAALVFLGVSVAVWRFGVRHYTSTGS